ncbi:MAG TPA: carbamoyltransferase HypF, partial [Ktedonobacteraceae bacterium]|nr:carbamoyltransferase HypF [Ktedonobacteraceae bacterium]
LVYQDEEARKRLHTLAEGALTHKREIFTRCDDTVLRCAAGGTQYLRRSRGYVPEPLPLPFETPVPLLACGGQLKNTFCLARGQQAFLSQHIGDLENLETLSAFQASIAHFQRLFAISPVAVAYDLHPEYLASKYALNLELPLKIGIQHHHAHIASVIAEHNLQEPVIGIAIDGTGYGTDGAIWGCEILRADLQDFQRLAHLAYVPLPGGEQAVRQPWRMAAVYLRQSFGRALPELDIPFIQQLNREKWHILDQMIARDLNCPRTSSLGRLFDAVAALLGLVDDSQQRLYEGQAAIELEQLASSDTGSYPGYPFLLGEQEPGEMDVRPMIRALVEDIQEDIPTSRIARRFHTSIATLLTSACELARQQTGLNTVALAGGVVQNALLLTEVLTRLESLAFHVYINRRVPPNDGGLSFGQIAIAAARLQAQQIEKDPLHTAMLKRGSHKKQEVSDVSGYSR